jgi:uncharacterized LabA/DUF88 family protein
MPDRMMVFVDYQNTYKGARDAFFPNAATGMEGQFHPLALANVLCQIRQEYRETELTKVLVYRGMPDVRKDPKGNSASSRQKARWEKAGIVVKTRPLRYPLEWPQEKPQEKGVDVQLAIDYVTMASRGEYDVGVLVSCDTDLRPALEEVQRVHKSTEVAAWQSGSGNSPRLSLPDGRRGPVWCHWLDLSVFERCCDKTDYNKPSPSESQTTPLK